MQGPSLPLPLLSLAMEAILSELLRNTSLRWPQLQDHMWLWFDYGISGITVYHNVYATCHWIHCNMIGVSHTSSFHTPSLYIFKCMMTMDPNVCMSMQLLYTIIDTNLQSALPLLFWSHKSITHSCLKLSSHSMRGSVFH